MESSDFLRCPTVLERAKRAGMSTIENRFFKVFLDPETGAIASIYDKELEREIVDRESPTSSARSLQGGRKAAGRRDPSASSRSM